MRRNCLLKHVIKGKIKGKVELKGRRRRIRKQILDILKETRGFCKLSEAALDRTLLKTRFGRGCGPVVRMTAVRMNKGIRSATLRSGNQSS